MRPYLHQSTSQTALPLNRLIAIGLSATVVIGLVTTGLGCKKSTRGGSAAQTKQEITAQQNKSDNLRDGMKYLKQLTPVNRGLASKEVLVELNTWIQNLPKDKVAYSPSAMLRQLPADWAQRSDINNPLQLNFDLWDVDYLYQCYLMNQLSTWIIDEPLRDSLYAPSIEKCKAKLSAEDAVRFEEAYKLFDWTVRNVIMEGDTSTVEKLAMDARQLGENTLGCKSLPWETVLFSVGDFVERGRVFAALAQQRGIDTVWISINGTATSPGFLWAIGVAIGSEMYLFEPKLGLVITDPDTQDIATLKMARENDRVLRRLDLPGQFDYAVNPGDLKSVILLIDAIPNAMSARMKMIEKSLSGSDRMRLFVDTDEITQRLSACSPNDPIAIWQTPLLARDYATELRDRLTDLSDFTARYMSTRGVWLMDTPVSKARFMHLMGKIESDSDEDGALSTYMKCRIDNETLEKLAYDPDIQKELQVDRLPTETKEVHEAKIRQSQVVYAQAKIHATFLLAQLHFDRGNYDAVVNWIEKRLLKDERAQQWHSAGHYLLGRAYQELGNMENAEKEFTHQPSLQEAGNRLRLRQLRKGS
jgi:hypothetical protein